MNRRRRQDAWCIDCVQRRIDEHGRFNMAEGLERAVAVDPTSKSNAPALCVEHALSRYQSPWPGLVDQVASGLKIIAQSLREGLASMPTLDVGPRGLVQSTITANESCAGELERIVARMSGATS